MHMQQRFCNCISDNYRLYLLLACMHVASYIVKFLNHLRSTHAYRDHAHLLVSGLLEQHCTAIMSEEESDNAQ